MKYDINELLDMVVKQGASDLHIQVGQSPALRVDGSIYAVDGDPLTPEVTEELMRSITSPTNQDRLKESGGIDFGFSFMDCARFRVSVLRAKGAYGMVLRQIPSEIFSFEDLGLPEMVKDLISRPRGLILVTGPTGSGKSTTLASMIDWINTHSDGHIITIEDPIEY